MAKENLMNLKNTVEVLDSDDQRNDSNRNVWYVHFKGFNFGPYEIGEISHKVRTHEFSLRSKLWTPGLRKWASLYDVPKLVKLIGLPPRQFVRAPFVAEVVAGGFFQNQKLQATSISLGGMGVVDLKAHEPGTKISLKIRSELLKENIYVKAIVLYEKNNMAGLKFLDLSEESSNLLLEYVKEFEIPELLTVA